MSRHTSTASEMQVTQETPCVASAERRFRILLVDDEPNILNALRRVFRREPYDIVTASSGHDALSLLENEPCHLMLSDFRMPRMDGGELIRRVRARYPEMVRIMLTGHADTTAVMDAINRNSRALSKLPESVESVMKRMCVPSGDHAGSNSLPGLPRKSR